MRSFSQIDALRREHRIAVRTLSRHAGTDRATWQRTASGATKPNVATLEKWSDAIDALIERKESPDADA